MKIINFLFAWINLASAALQLTVQNKILNALGNHNKNRYVVNQGVPSYYLQVCLFDLEQATTYEQRSRSLSTYHCKQAVNKKLTSNEKSKARRASFRNRRYRDYLRNSLFRN